MRSIKLSPAEIAAIESVLARDERVTIIPTKDKVRIMRVRNDEVKVDANTEYITKY